MVVKQIYSIVNYNEAVQVMDAGADHIGLVPMQSGGVPAHRVPYDVVDKIYGEAKKRGVKTVAIMLNKDVEEMLFIAKRVKPDILHIAGMDYTADQEFADRLHKECPGIKLMQAILVDGHGAVQTLEAKLISFAVWGIFYLGVLVRSCKRYRNWSKR